MNCEYTKIPGLCDVHVHFREPGFSYKETIKSGTLAAAHGGYTTVCTMPNLNPVPDSPEHLKAQTDIIEKKAVIETVPYGAITLGQMGEELSDMREIADSIVAFSDDGRGVQDDGLMGEAMTLAGSLDKMIVAHCEVNDLLNGGYIHDGRYAREHGHNGICSESEWRQIERDIRLSAETGCAYHVCHISCKESVEIIREAKKSGIDVSCETAPHYLLLSDNDLREDGRFKMNPPLRSPEDKKALIDGLCDGTIDMIATDHAPHSDKEKSKGLKDSLFGITGLEIAFPLLYTGLVKTGIIPFDKLVELMSTAPRKRFKLPVRENDYSLWNLEKEFTVTPDAFLSKGHATPFEDVTLYGVCEETYYNGKCVYKRKRHSFKENQ